MERYRKYLITPIPQKTRTGRYSVAVRIELEAGAVSRGSATRQGGSTDPRVSATYYADDGITYVLPEEAGKEGVNLAHRLIERGLVREKYLE